ncbi:MAG: hypothetical protein M0R77_00200 [Gammaproteobacteria bacterium]|nr:hypothetical protein [Acholeplasmataceae bacterium]MCK9528975.1 hypothetical protein [Gammaproteobacteria bacterium]
MKRDFTEDQLREALNIIKEDPFLRIDIGFNEEGKMVTELRIRYMPTAGGVQFSVKGVSWNGEHSGIYFHSEDDAFNYINDKAIGQIIERCDRLNRFRQNLGREKKYDHSAIILEVVTEPWQATSLVSGEKNE